jgi:hypothetical protein
MSHRNPTSLDEFLSLLDLETVRVNEIAGRRRDAFELQDWPASEGQAEVKVRSELEGSMFSLRCRIELHTPHAILTADVVALFRLTDTIERPSEEIVDEFAAREGLPILFPYLRVVAQQAARQIGVPAPKLKPYWARDFARMLRQGN